jgi:sec-independent protein translocase protein TatC
MAHDEDREAELEEGRMPFVEHLRELRKRLRNAAAVFVVAFIGCWIFAEDIYVWVRVPIDDAWHAHPERLCPDKVGPCDPQMFYPSVITPFWLYISVALWAAIFVSSPAIFHQLWQFIAPGLYKRERRIGIGFAMCSAVCFIAGAAFCYYVVLERLYEFLLGYSNQEMQPVLFITEYFDLTRNMMLAFGAVFELPMLILFLAMAGAVTHRGLWKFNRWFVIIAFVVGAVLTPSPDVVSQVLMALPMIILYNISIVIAWIVVRRREKREARERAAEAAADAEE